MPSTKKTQLCIYIYMYGSIKTNPCTPPPIYITGIPGYGKNMFVVYSKYFQCILNTYYLCVTYIYLYKYFVLNII